MKKFIVEFIGTFYLVFTVGVTVINPEPGVIAPLAIGSVLMVMVYAGGHISGGHYNPAITVAVAMRGRMPASAVPSYFLAQLMGAVMGSGASYYLKGANQMAGAPPPAYVLSQLVFAEFIFTFALAFVFLNVATTKSNAGNSFYGLAIGFTMMVGTFAVGPISGGAFNPAVATGFYYLGLVPRAHCLAYIAAELSAGAIASFIFKVVNPDDK